MRTIAALLSALLLLTALPAAGGVAQTARKPLSYGVVTYRNVAFAMSDGVTL